MDQTQLKRKAAEAALRYIENEIAPGLRDPLVIGIGTGSTVNEFIPLLAKSGLSVDACVSSSEASTKLLRQHGFDVQELNYTGPIPVYVDGADEATSHKQLTKGGGGALTREKIVAQAAETFICIVDESKRVDVLGDFPLPVEVLPMARSLVGRAIVGLGGQPVVREGFETDNGNYILDCHNMDLVDPRKREQQINNIPGVVANGLFALRPADVLITAYADGTIKTS